METLDEADGVFLDEVAFAAGLDGFADEAGDVDPRAGVAVHAVGRAREFLQGGAFKF